MTSARAARRVTPTRSGSTRRRAPPTASTTSARPTRRPHSPGDNMRRTLVLLFTAAAVAAAHASSAQTQLKPGKWEVNVRMEIPNIPGGAMPPTKALVCVTEEASKKPYMISTQQQTSTDCAYGEPKVDGSKVSTAMTCQGGAVKGTFD